MHSRINKDYGICDFYSREIADLFLGGVGGVVVMVALIGSLFNSLEWLCSKQRVVLVPFFLMSLL